MAWFPEHPLVAVLWVHPKYMHQTTYQSNKLAEVTIWYLEGAHSSPAGVLELHGELLTIGHLPGICTHSNTHQNHWLGYIANVKSCFLMEKHNLFLFTFFIKSILS